MKERLLRLLHADASFSEDRETALYEFGLSRKKHYIEFII